ncbi:hypothetical protein OEZ86_004834 [Tetradesmus obliquus]|uniref:V-type proton ATPase subunit F n=2 Tax=Tetradesmus obliquus TaxID=3088 RepID=A0A383VD30_TETOB|nr:hypothetical protein OEZ85_005277 [Tetradesmus obliquus]WIA41219.1 hypothetical protein OEZ86_004834 [Tetradesmus obliquus]|eukprot:jgi/Sobl393_1/7242/SZX77464.1
MARIDQEGSLVAVIADEDTITGFLLAGVGDVDIRKRSNFLVVDSKTTVRTIEASFKDFTNREDIAIILISQPIANMIRHVVANHNKPVPALLEIPSKDSPYDPNQDSLLTRVKHLLGLV